MIGIKNATSGGAGAQMRQGLRMRAGEKNHQRRQTLVYPDGKKMAMVSGIHDSIPWKDARDFTANRRRFTIALHPPAAGDSRMAFTYTFPAILYVNFLPGQTGLHAFTFYGGMTIKKRA